MDYLLTYADRGFSGNPYDAGNGQTYSMDALPQEYPCYLEPEISAMCIDIENADGSMSCDLRYKSHMNYQMENTILFRDFRQFMQRKRSRDSGDYNGRSGDRIGR